LRSALLEDATSAPAGRFTISKATHETPTPAAVPADATRIDRQRAPATPLTYAEERATPGRTIAVVAVAIALPIAVFMLGRTTADDPPPPVTAGEFRVDLGTEWQRQTTFGPFADAIVEETVVVAPALGGAVAEIGVLRSPGSTSDPLLPRFRSDVASATSPGSILLGDRPTVVYDGPTRNGGRFHGLVIQTSNEDLAVLCTGPRSAADAFVLACQDLAAAARLPPGGKAVALGPDMAAAKVLAEAFGPLSTSLTAAQIDVRAAESDADRNRALDIVRSHYATALERLPSRGDATAVRAITDPFAAQLRSVIGAYDELLDADTEERASAEASVTRSVDALRASLRDLSRSGYEVHET
jgi:hypothetical protein